MTEAPERVFAVIVGTGFGGLAMAIRLKQAGIHDLVLLEKADAIGGTWRDNHYPGAACDVPAHLYSFSFAPNPDWSCAYAPQPEIRAYMERCADQLGVRPHVRLRAQVTSAELDERRAIWTVRCADGRVYVADIVVAATGGLSRPLVPTLPGLDRFTGRTWHSARWDHDYDLGGKTVAVVGTGASAIQFVPRIAPKVAKLHLLQRTPPWVLPRPDHVFTADEKRRFRAGPRRWLYRQALYWRHEARAIPFTLEPRILRLAQRMAVKHLERHIADPALRAKLTPDYVMGCKRVLMSNDYYPALARPNVEVVTDRIREVTARGLVVEDGSSAGRAIAVDAIAFGTGFDVHDYLGPVRVIGRDGEELGARWRRSAEAYLGTTVPGFPNFFTIVGPNTGLGHNSIIVMIEAQVRHVMACLAAMRERGAVLIEPRVDATRRYNDELQRRLARTVWASGCASWYQDPAGRNTTLWPGLTAEFAARTWRCDPRAYRMLRRDELPRAVPVPLTREGTAA
jgi:cation diffusion facilitator CzcD-associated flavoprotein CzcO